MPNMYTLLSTERGSQVLLAAIVFGAAITAAFGANASLTKGVGPVTFHYGHMSGTGVGKPNFKADLTNGFTITSDRYDINGATAHLSGTPAAIEHITADGAPVDVKFKNQAEGTAIRFESDHVDVTPDPTPDQPKQLKAVFTGHVTMYVSNYAALEHESKSTMDSATVYLGSGDDYPKIEADNVNGTAVPAEGH